MTSIDQPMVRGPMAGSTQRRDQRRTSELFEFGLTLVKLLPVVPVWLIMDLHEIGV